MPPDEVGSQAPFDDDNSTPLTPDEKLGLIPSWVTFRHELNEAEQGNIARGLIWAVRRPQKREILDVLFVRELHKRMFGEVWGWAGTFRSTEKNIGVAPWQISTALRDLLDDARTWIELKTYDADEIAIRFHHRLALIHPFPNGNGRHSRLMADLLAQRAGRPPFTWGSAGIAAPVDTRARYIQALRQADVGDISQLLLFARSW